MTDKNLYSRRVILCVPILSIYSTILLLVRGAYGPMMIIGEMSLGMTALAGVFYWLLAFRRNGERSLAKAQLLVDLQWSAKWSAYIFIVMALLMGLTGRL